MQAEWGKAKAPPRLRRRLRIRSKKRSDARNAPQRKNPRTKTSQTCNHVAYSFPWRVRKCSLTVSRARTDCQIYETNKRQRRKTTMTRSLQIKLVQNEQRRMYANARSVGFGGFVSRVLGIFVFGPLYVLAGLGLLRNRGRASQGPGPLGDGPAHGNVGAPLPTIPPTLSGANARAFPPAE